MSYQISKELFEAVMKDDIFNNSGDWGQLTEEKYINKSIKEIDYDNFFFKCKKWAFWNDYEIIVRMRIIDIYRDEHKIDYGYEINHTNNGIIKTSWWIGSEQQAVFNACQWLLDNKDKQ